MKEQEFQGEGERFIAGTNQKLSLDTSSLQLGRTIESTVRRFQEIHKETAHHGLRVGHYSMRLAEELSLASGERINILYGGIFHDIGKAADVLLVENKLNENERDFVENHTHAEVGAKLLKNMSYPESIVTIVRDHHKNHSEADGCLSISTQVVKVADRFDAIQSKRFYKPETSYEQALLLLRGSYGVHFDERLQVPFEKIVKEIFEN